MCLDGKCCPPFLPTFLPTFSFIQQSKNWWWLGGGGGGLLFCHRMAIQKGTFYFVYFIFLGIKAVSVRISE